MPARESRLRCRRIFTLIVALFLVPASVAAQTGQVTLQGRVSETVALSVLPSFSHRNVHTEVLSSGNTVRLTLSSSDAEPTVVRVPLLVRSNSGFKISAVFESNTAALTQLSVIDADLTGVLASPYAANALRVTPQFDLRRLGEGTTAPLSLDISQPLLVFSGPRVSLGGTLRSPNNALQVTLVIRLQSQPDRGWSSHLTLIGTPE
jgi:hypothetical protein